MRLTRLEVSAWIVVLAVAWATLAVTGYRSRDPDSRLHAAIESDLQGRPAGKWIAPEWAGHWNNDGLYREHPVGTFVPPAVLARAGYPAEQAGYAVNAVYQVLGLLAVAKLAACFVSAPEARSLVWLLQLIPIAFTYRIRANHEPAVLFFLFVALYGTERSRRAPAWVVLTLAGVLGMMLVKGLFVVLVLLSCVLWLIASRACRPSDRWAWAGIGLSALGAALGAAAYELVYRSASGESFAAEYLRRQLGVAAEQAQAGLGVVARKLRNLYFYVIRLAWFAFPWSVFLGLAPWLGRVSSSGRPPGRHDVDPAAGGALLGVLAVAALWVVGFSLSDRLADRFIFPVYYLVAAAGAVLAMRAVPAAARFVAAVERRVPLTGPVVWLAAFFLQLVSPHLGLPFVNR